MKRKALLLIAMVMAALCACGSVANDADIIGVTFTIIPTNVPTDIPTPTIHVHMYSENVITEATCTTEGAVTSICDGCGDVVKQSIPATGEHVYNEDVIATEATCAVVGEKIYTCATCGEVKREEIPATGEHVYDEGVITTEATCAAVGEKIYTCALCDGTITKEVPVTEEHSYDEGTVITKATCVVVGEKRYTCTVCNKTYMEEIPVTDKHVWDDGEVTKEPTCGKEGTRLYTCTVCETTKKNDIDATGEHTWKSEGKVEKEPTCVVEGKITYTCSVCSSEKSESLPKTEEHPWNSGKVTTEPTHLTEGVYTYTCKKCKTTKTESIDIYNFNPADYGDPYCIRTSYNPENYVEFKLDGNTLTVSGRILMDKLRSVWITCGEKDEKISIKSGEFFSKEITLDSTSEKTMVEVYVSNGGLYIGYVWNIYIEYINREYRFEKSLVLNHNLEVLSHWVDPQKCLSDKISDQIIKLSNEIVGNETDEYKKLYMLNQWVAENIYYDHDYYFDKSETVYAADEVFETRRSVCSGYANILLELVQAQGIPCIKVTTYAVGAGTSGMFNEKNSKVSKSNHAHVEAYVEGRWIIMDATWDSRNIYRDGEFVTRTPLICHFDASLECFALTHKIIDR